MLILCNSGLDTEKDKAMQRIIPALRSLQSCWGDMKTQFNNTGKVGSLLFTTGTFSSLGFWRK